MKISVTTISGVIAVLLGFLLEETGAICSNATAVCGPEANTCSETISTFLGGGSLGDAIGALSYGKYCGGTNECVPTADPTNENQCKMGTEGCPSAPCDAVDAACQVHDTCLHSILTDNPNADGVPIPDRCYCDAVLVATGAQIAVTSPIPTGACDVDYYTVTLPVLGITPIELITPEAGLVACPFCCAVLDDGCEQDARDNYYMDVHLIASTFCRVVLKGLNTTAGIDICSSGNVPQISGELSYQTSGAFLNCQGWWAAVLALVAFSVMGL